jgi:hypothetical protein
MLSGGKAASREQQFALARVFGLPHGESSLAQVLATRGFWAQPFCGATCIRRSRIANDTVRIRAVVQREKSQARLCLQFGAFCSNGYVAAPGREYVCLYYGRRLI